MATIELGAPEVDAPAPAPRSPRQYSTLVVALVSAVSLAVGLILTDFRPHHTPEVPEVPEVRINVGVSPYPAPAAASWRGADGAVHRIDVWSGEPVTARAVEVTVSVARLNGAPAQCDLYINGQVKDLATISPQEQAATCSWVR